MMRREVAGRQLSMMIWCARSIQKSKFTIASLSLHFPQISKTILYEIVSDRLNYRKLCSRWVPKMLGRTLLLKLKP
jgi:hypothetical protein